MRSLPDFLKVGAEAGRGILHARFHFPEIARQRYKEHFDEVEAQTGWLIQVPDGVHQEALAAMARTVLPPGLSPLGTPSLYHQQSLVLIQTQGGATQEEVQAAQERFAAETGWQLTITVPGSREQSEQAPRLAQGEALAQISAAFRGNLELYRIGVDSRLKIFWLHFHFPEKARERYGTMIAQLEEETGWRLSLHPHVHQKALVEAALRLLPAEVNKKSLLQDALTLRLVVSHLPDADEQKKIARHFREATGWALELEVGAK